MGFTLEQLTEHCKIIIRSRRIKNKIVVLCEGEGGIWNIEGRPSPQSYRKMEQMPDANFYKACVPEWWSQYRPEFFNCGDRKDVLDTYLTLLELHNEDSANSYLSPEKLFAIVDLDLQVQNIKNYDFSDTEQIFDNLYKKLEVNRENTRLHRIWVTGLIHKEAYFIIPELQPIFDDNKNTPLYNGSHVLLDNIYIDMADNICVDSDLQNSFLKVSNRISYCTGIDCSCVDQLQNSWKDQFQKAIDNLDDQRKIELALALLTIKKAKAYWNQIQAPSDWPRTAEVFREQLSLEIGRQFYSKQSNDAQYHIPFFIETLYKFI
jgi:hypothetical protein